MKLSLVTAAGFALVLVAACGSSTPDDFTTNDAGGPPQTLPDGDTRSPDGAILGPDGGVTTLPDTGTTGGDSGTKPGMDAGNGGHTVTPSTGVTIIVEPNGNDASELVDAINGATQSVHMTMYEMDSSSIINALIARKRAGLDVKVVLDSSSSTSSTNHTTASTLQSGGVGVVFSSSQFTYTHEKCVILGPADGLDHDHEPHDLLAGG